LDLRLRKKDIRAEINPTPTPDDIEPTKVSRNWRIIIKRFSPPAA